MAESNQVKWVGIRPTNPASDPIPVSAPSNLPVTIATEFWTTDYEEEDGTGADAYNDDNTYEFDEAWLVWDILIETFAAFISFRKANGEWGDAKPLPVGMYSIVHSSTGLRVQNRVAGSNCAYSFTRYR